MDSPYFDSTYFDPDYFDTDVAPDTSSGGGPGKRGKRRGRQLLARPPQAEDEDWIVLIT